MAKSEKKMAYDNAWNAKTYYRPAVCLRREYEDATRERAKDLGLTVSNYIQELIKKDLDEKIL